MWDFWLAKWQLMEEVFLGRVIRFSRPYHPTIAPYSYFSYMSLTQLPSSLNKTLLFIFLVSHDSHIMQKIHTKQGFSKFERGRLRVGSNSGAC
jgi:hypothetical protein